MKIECKKLIATALTGVVVMSSMAAISLTASAAEVTDSEKEISSTVDTIGADGYENYSKGTYKCVSTIGVWLKSKPNDDDDNKKLYVIPTDCVIEVTKTDGRWGYTEVTDENGKKYKGWTFLNHYLQVFDEPQQYAVLTDTYMMADPWNGYTDIFGTVMAGQTVQLTQVFQNSWALVTAEIDTVWDTHEEIEAWVYVTDIEKCEESDSTYYLDADYTEGSNWDIIYKYLRKELNFNSAAAQAILTNIGFESGWNPTAWCVDTNGLISYGICQWNGGRYTELQNYCDYYGLDYTSLYGQLEYLKYELTTNYYGQYLGMFNYDDSAEGCRDAAYYWASKFEVCSSKYWSQRASSAYYNYDSSLA